MDQTLITVLRYSITYYQKDLFICAHYAKKHKATALHKAYWLPCGLFDWTGQVVHYCLLRCKDWLWKWIVLMLANTASSSLYYGCLRLPDVTIPLCD